VKNQFGYVKSKPESGCGPHGPRQQPPISRPVPSPLPPPPPHHDSLSAAMRGLLDPRLYAGSENTSSGPAAGLLSKRFNNAHQPMNSPATNSAAFTSGSQLSSLLNCASIAELAGSAGIGPYDTSSSSSRNIISMNSAFDKPVGGLSAFEKSGLGGGGGPGGMNAYESSGHIRGSGVLSGGNPYERWSNGSDSLFGLGGGGGVHGGGLTDCGVYKEQQQQRLVGSSSHADMLADLVGGSSSKLLSASGGSGQPMSSNGSGGSSSGPPLYPPKSQIKRQKMIYHCKFGEFGILGEI
jgi:hypothetical protein